MTTDKSVTVKLFGPLREQLGTESLEIPLESETSLENVLESLFERYPVLREHRDSLALSVNHDLVEDRSTPLSPGDEIGLLPPFGGGSR